MILVDTSVWADHLRRGEIVLSTLLTEARVLMHPFVTGELALGNLRDWNETVATLGELPQMRVATQTELLSLISRERLSGTGIGLIDAHLLASLDLAPGSKLWTRDKRLAARADAMGVGWPEPQV